MQLLAFTTAPAQAWTRADLDRACAVVEAACQQATKQNQCFN